MDFITFTAAYLGITAVLVFVMLFGELPLFTGTPVERLHWFLTQGICEGSDWLISKIFGARGAKAVDSVMECCCERSNPTLQIAYLFIVAAGYYLFWTSLFTRLPTKHLGEEHLFIGTGLVCVSLTFFAAASMSDPGRVTEENVDVHRALYPYDDAIWPPKECWTCKFDRPARSKHCSVCARCVPRFDHHCGWINNCVGLMNTRLFIGFLLSNIIMCIYGVWLAASIVMSEMEREGLVYYMVTDKATGQRMPLFKSPARMFEFVIIYYPIPSVVALFLIVAALLLFAFLAYQMQLIMTGKTTYEAFRWREYHKQLIDDAEKEADNLLAKGEGGKGRGWLRWLGLRRRSAVAAQVQLPPNMYHRGWWGNLCEVMLPGMMLQSASDRLKKAE